MIFTKITFFVDINIDIAEVSISFERPKRLHQLLTAPIFDKSDNIYYKEKISLKSDILTLTK